MNPQALELNQIIAQNNANVLEMLSDRGKNIFFPKKGILGQTAEARGTAINATIGSAIEDDGSPMRLDAIASKVDLDPSLIFPYAPSFGRPDLRTIWKNKIYEKNISLGKNKISLPVVTSALTHAVSIAGYLFADQGEEIIVPGLFWGNYTLILTNAWGAGLRKFKLFKDGKIDIEAFEESLNSGKPGKKILLLNFPNNPSGYTPSVEEAEAIVSAIKSSAEKGNKIVAIIDDAYFGLVYEDGISKESIFAPLSNIHENVLAVKIDGPTKEDYVWGLRVGFITFGIKGGNAGLYNALEAKTAGAIRGNISNASNLSQSLLVAGYSSSNYLLQKEAKYNIMRQRFKAVKDALKNPEYHKYFTPLPFNSGYFMCIKLAEGLNGEAVRQVLIKNYSIGTISLDNLLRIAYSAVSAKDIPILFESIYKACIDTIQ